MQKKIICYKMCIPEQYQISSKVYNEISKNLEKIKWKASTGRPPIDVKMAIQAIYYILKTGMQWKALPRCFGSSSAIHRMFRNLENLGFFKLFWMGELEKYSKKHSEALQIQSIDTSHIPAPLAQDVVGKSPVNRGKQGSKRSVAVDKNGVPLGYVLGAGNTHDSQFFIDTLLSIPTFVKQCTNWPEMHLDAAYDAEIVKTALFNCRYMERINKNKRRSQNIPLYVARRYFVEASHSWINRFRRLAIRFEKKAKLYSAFAHFAFGILTFSKL